MKKIKIGIPRALLYHRYGVFWKNFFQKIGCKIILSHETDSDIIKLGVNNTIDECCLAYKIYVGHVLSLKEKSDYIIISRVCDYGRKEKVCTRFNGIYDDIKYIIPKKQILDYDICHTKLKFALFGFIKIGLKITPNIFKIIYSYIYAKAKQKKYNINKINEQKHKLLNSNKKILIMSHFYNIEDKYISSYIIEYLKNANITPIFSNRLNNDISAPFSEYFSNTLYWKYSKEMIGSLYFYQYQIDGIIFISTYPCGIDALVNNLAILKNKQLPILNLVIDENVTQLSLETKLESFVDIIKGEYHA